ncbi:MAG: isoaspartyl peptidase/L-asparaginase family protein [Bacteroidia bacterium]
MSHHAIAIHGGAGTILRSVMTPEKESEYKSALKDAILAGEAILKQGGLALDAVTEAICRLEDNPLFNAGKGSVFTHDGKNEMDASIMDGKLLMSGALSGVRNIRNPIFLARTIMEKSDHVFLAGSGAADFAKIHGLKFEPDEYFFVEMRHQQLLQALEADQIILDHTETNIPNIDHLGNTEKKFGTVGAVALDVHGNMAAGTSTGGMTNKKHGRIGDSPIIGAGTYANNQTCAVSCTGHGEFFIRGVVAYDVSCLMEYKGLSLMDACDMVVHHKLVQLGGEGGLIALDAQGNIELSFNSIGMYRAMKRSDENVFIGIYKDETPGDDD